LIKKIILIQFNKKIQLEPLVIPTPKHFLPLLHVLISRDKKDKTTLFKGNPLSGSTTMTNVKPR